MLRYLFVFVVLICLVGVNFIGSSMANPKPADKFGAIAYCRSTNVYGYAINQVSRNVAEATATAYCKDSGGTNCRAEVWFKNTCGAVSVSRDKKVFWAYGPTQARARQLALEECSKTQVGCKIVYGVCSGV